MLFEGIENFLNKNSLHQISELNPGNFTFDTLIVKMRSWVKKRQAIFAKD